MPSTSKLRAYTVKECLAEPGDSFCCLVGVLCVSMLRACRWDAGNAHDQSWATTDDVGDGEDDCDDQGNQDDSELPAMMMMMMMMMLMMLMMLLMMMMMMTMTFV